MKQKLIKINLSKTQILTGQEVLTKHINTFARQVRQNLFCDLKKRTEFRLATDLPSEGEGAVSNEEIAEIYVQRWQIELLWKFLKMHLKLDNLITKNENGIRIQIYK